MSGITVWGGGDGARKIAKCLGGTMNNPQAQVFIRWRTTRPLPSHQRVLEINSQEAVALASHKYNSLVKIQQRGVSVPPLSRSLRTLDRDQIIFARTFYHSKGSDIIVLKDGADLPCGVSRDYFIQYLPATAEYRYHVAFGRVILSTKKILADGAVDDTMIRNHQSGKWKQVVCQKNRAFADASIKAVTALGLDFGAVDFLDVRGVPTILEVNTAPGLSISNRVEAYKNAFEEHINSAFGR